MNVNFKKLVREAVTPTYATSGSACFDLYSMTSGVVRGDLPLQCATGIAVEVPDDHVMLVFSRSGHGFKDDVRLANCVGVIDSDYRGEINVKMTAERHSKGMSVHKGDRIAQGMIIPVTQINFREVSELTTTFRGEGGMGSTGA